MRLYEEYRSFLARFAQLLFPWTAPYFPDHMILHAQIAAGGRSIVITAGDELARHALTLIPTLHRLGCTLPIEVMYFDDGELTEDNRAALRTLARCRHARLEPDDRGYRVRFGRRMGICARLVSQTVRAAIF